MNEDELITLVRDQRDKVPLSVPVEDIIRRGRTLHTRRMVPGVVGGLALASAVAVALSGQSPADHQPARQTTTLSTHPTSHQPAHLAGHPAASQPSSQPTVRLAAWTVTKLPDGNISVTVRQLQDPAGLQSTLRSDGVPASVTFGQQTNPACEPYPGGSNQQPPGPGSTTQISPLLKAVFPKPYKNLPPSGPPLVRPASGAPTRPLLNPNSTLIVIDPSALPSNAGVELGTSPSRTAFLMPQVVYASPQCTGS